MQPRHPKKVWTEACLSLYYISFSFCSYSDMSSGLESAAAESQVVSLDAAADCVRWQVSKVFSSPCDYINHGSMPISHAMLPKDSEVTFNSGFLPLVFRHWKFPSSMAVYWQESCHMIQNWLISLPQTLTQICKSQLSLWWMLLSCPSIKSLGIIENGVAWIFCTIRFIVLQLIFWLGTFLCQMYISPCVSSGTPTSSHHSKTYMLG